jgi:sterol desaturase/sphingolipid hydroxylase (fatty acid hydroxylase superfamily)
MKEAGQFTNLFINRYGFPVLAVLIVVYLVMETRRQLRQRYHNRWTRMVTNVVMAIPAFGLLRFGFIPAMVWLAMQNQHWQFGLNYLYQLPFAAEGTIAFLGLDYFIYLWHILTHRVPLLWRFHLVHHTDLDMDVSTAIRFHFGELFFSLFFRGASVVVTGASPLTVLVYEIIFEACTNFHHSNWRLPLGLENALNRLIVTPRMHGIHHSSIVAERNSNWGTVFSFWDRLHQTLSLRQKQTEVVIGEAPYRDENELTIGKLLTMPFRKIKDQAT